MRKRIQLIGLFILLLSTTVGAQEAAKMSAEERKEAKALRKAEEAEEKAAKKQAKRDKNQAKFDEFLANWEPVDYSDIDSLKMPSTVQFFQQSNELFATMKNVEDYIDYIQIEILEEDEEGIVEMKIFNKNTGEDIAKSDALATYASATLDLTNAALTAAIVALTGTSSLTEMATNPLLALTLGKKVKNTLDAVKYSMVAIPLIKAKIQDNTDAVRQSKNN